MTTQVGQLVGSKYELVEMLGQGGFGTVYRARDQMLGRDVAIKLMRVDQEERETAMQRFFAEARNTSRLVHPNNVRVFDFGYNDDGQVYLVMEYVTGEPLSKLPVPIDAHRMLHIGVQVARALDEAHELGIVHRDLKPDNVMIGSMDGREFARVLDYGIAKLENSKSGLTQTGGFIGTAEYAAPEQLRARGVDRRTDIYTFGVMLWSLIAGRPLFEAEDAISIAYMHVHEAPRSLRDFARVSNALDALVMKCLQKQPDERYGSMGEVLSALQSLPEYRSVGGETAVASALSAQVTTQPEATGTGPTVAADELSPSQRPSESQSAMLPAENLRRPGRSMAVLAALALTVGIIGAVLLSRGDAEPGAMTGEPSLAAAEAANEASPETVEAPPEAVSAPEPVAPTAEQIAETERRARDVAAPCAAAATAVARAIAADEQPPAPAARPATRPAPPRSAPEPRAAAERRASASTPPTAAPDRGPSSAPDPTPEEAAPTPVAEPAPEAEPAPDEPSRSRRDRLRETLGGQDEPAPSRRDRLREAIGGE